MGLLREVSPRWGGAEPLFIPNKLLSGAKLLRGKKPLPGERTSRSPTGAEIAR